MSFPRDRRFCVPMLHSSYAQALIETVFQTLRSEKWGQVLPSNALRELLNPDILTVIDGYILKPDIGMTAQEVAMLKRDVDIIIHTASSINLGRSFGRVANSVIDGSEKLASLALECGKLKRFVYVSTAYANSYLYNETDSPDVKVDEFSILWQRRSNQRETSSKNGGTSKPKVPALNMRPLTFHGHMHMPNISLSVCCTRCSATPDIQTRS